ncbi:hypothetical protein [Frankia sp. Cr2]|uniref:tetratricopeptide repeat protein n=1 Tax=Frankia sp. Cr2 TaxID=3073932 RepID=UPI002AD49412|nr:hypothetical protein [Frankia sp. Cr2]
MTRQQPLPPKWPLLLQLCAVAHIFDRRALKEILRPEAGLDDSPGLDVLEWHGLVEKAPGRKNQFRLETEEREYYLKSWWRAEPGRKKSTELQNLSKKLAHYQKKRNNRLEYFRHIMIADPAEARRLFTAEFAAADRARDFARFRDALSVLGDEFRLDRADLHDYYDEWAGYFRRQQYWSVEYRRSAHFLPPHGWREQVERLLAGDSGVRGWYMFGADGSGKSMGLQWLIARRCVPAHPGEGAGGDGPLTDIPCARVDLGALDPVILGRHPWLILLPIAAQLQLHTDTANFEWLIGHYEMFAGLLRPAEPSEQIAAAARILSDDQAAADIGRKVTDEFIAKIELPSRNSTVIRNQLVVVVVDTVEALLNFDEEKTRDLLRLFADVHRRCSALRLIIAGRHSELLASGLETTGFPTTDGLEVPAWFADLEKIEVTNFDEETAGRYLREIRGIEDRDLVVTGVCQAGGSPLALALYADLYTDLHADLINQDGVVAAAELEMDGQPALPHLLEKVVLTIVDPAVRWLLRYGVVPRRLRLDAVRTVMRPHLEQIMAGLADADNPLAPNVFPHTSQAFGDDELDQIWAGLLSHAGILSFLQHSLDDPESVVFHSRTRRCMRELVAEEQVFKDLHRAFAQDFLRKSVDFDPGQGVEWVSCYREVVYHKFQCADPGALDEWRGALLRCRRAGAVDDLTVLARDVLGEDYQDEDGNPTVGSLVPGEADLLLAYAAARRARLHRANAPDPRWSAAARHLSRYDQLCAEPSPRPVLAAAVRAAVRLAEGAAREALEIAESVLDVASGHTPEDLGDKIDVWQVVGDCRAALGDDRTIEAYEQALEAATGWSGREEEITLALADYYEQRGDFDAALRAVTDGGSPSVTLKLRRIDLLLRCAEPQEAANTARRALTDPAPPVGRADMAPAERAALTRAKAEAALLLGDEQAALACLDQAMMIVDDDFSSVEDGIHHRALTLQLHASLLGELLMLDEAGEKFREAGELWRGLGYTSGHLTWRLAYGTFLMRDVGDMATASEELPDDVSKPPAVEPNGRFDEVAVRIWLLAVQAQAIKASGAEILTFIGVLTDCLTAMTERVAPPQIAARVAVTGLVLCHQSSNTQDVRAEAGLFAVRLTAELPKIRPVTARFLPLADLEFCDTPQSDSDELKGLRSEVAKLSGPGVLLSNTTLRTSLFREARRVCRDQRSLGSPPPETWPLLARWRWSRPSDHYAELNPDPGQRNFDPILRDHLESLVEGSLPDSDDRLWLLRAWAFKLLAKQLPAAGETRDADNRDAALQKAIGSAGQVRTKSRWTAAIHDARAAIVPSDQRGGSNDKDKARRIYEDLGRPAPPQEIKVCFEDASGTEWCDVTGPEGVTVDIDELQRLMAADETYLPLRLVAVLTGITSRSIDGDGLSDTLRLQSDEPRVQMLPWELADPPAADGDRHRWPNMYRCMPTAGDRVNTRWLEAARATDVSGLANLQIDSATATLPVSPGQGRTLYRSLQLSLRGKDADDSVPLVAIVRPATRSGYQVKPSGESMLFDIVRVYEECDYLVLPIRRSALGNTGLRLIATDDLPTPTILHLRAPLAMIGDSPCLDFSADGPHRRPAGGIRGTDVRPRAVASWIAECEPGTAPVVVLDPPQPGSPADFHSQLLLRNLFAALLFQEAATPVVVATGLELRHSIAVARALAKGLRQQGDVLAAIRDLRERVWADAMPKSGGINGWATRATAVFAATSALIRA